MENTSVCPVDFVSINESQPRLIAGAVIVLTVLFLVTGQGWIMAFVCIDFLFRALKWGHYSLLGKGARYVIRRFHLSGALVDQAPKRFAAKLGLCLSLVITILSFAGMKVPAVLLSLLLIVFALLESVFNLCVGCRIYTWGTKLKIFR